MRASGGTVEKILKNKWDGGTMEKWQAAVMCSEMAGGRNNVAETNWEWLPSWGPALVPLEGHSAKKPAVWRWENLWNWVVLCGEWKVRVCKGRCGRRWACFHFEDLRIITLLLSSIPRIIFIDFYQAWYLVLRVNICEINEWRLNEFC